MSREFLSIETMIWYSIGTLLVLLIFDMVIHVVKTYIRIEQLDKQVFKGLACIVGLLIGCAFVLMAICIRLSFQDGVYHTVYLVFSCSNLVICFYGYYVWDRMHKLLEK